MIKWMTVPVILLLSSTGYSQDNFGPLLTYSQSPFHANSLTPQIRSGFPIPQLSTELSITGTVASIWVDTPNYHADYYQNQLSLSGKWHLNSEWLLELNYRWNYAENNGLDGLTTAFHDLFNIDQNGRDKVDDDQFIINIPEYSIDLEDFDGRTLSNALTTYLQYQLLLKDKHGLSFGYSLYYNDVNKGIFSSNRFEQGLQLNYSYNNTPHFIDSLIGISFRHSPDALKDFPFKQNTAAGGLSYRYLFSSNHYLVAQIAIFEGVSNGEDEFSSPSTEITYGYRYQMESSSIEFSIIENAFNADNSTDIAFTLGYRYQITEKNGP